MAILSARYRSICLNRFVTFTAVLPFENYGEDYFHPSPDAFGRPEPMKTLYLLHGLTGDEQDWLYGTRIARYAEEEGIAIIMPNGLNSFYVDQGASSHYGEFIGRELVQSSRAMFPLSDRREDTYIGGLSMGGYGAIRNGLKYHDTFSKIISLSGALMAGQMETEQEQGEWRAHRTWREEALGRPEDFPDSDRDLGHLFLENGSDTDFFIAVGTSDFLLEKNREFRDFLQANGARLTYREDIGAHEWDFWDRNILRAMRWLKK